MTYFISIEEIKQNNVINANVDSEYIEPALREAQDIYLREIIGDALYAAIENKINGNNLTGKYQTLVNQYIKPYLENRMLASLVVPITMKIRNAGVIQQYDQGFNSPSVKDVSYLADYYAKKVEFYGNRMTDYLAKNASDIPEWRVSAENVTNPTVSQNASTIYLGGTRKRPCMGNYGQSGGSLNTVDWDNIQNRPDFATVATSGDYNDLSNKPDIPQPVQSDWAQTDDTQPDYIKNKPSVPSGQVQSDWNQTNQNEVDFIKNKPAIPTKTSDLTNDSNFITSSDIPAQVNSDWDSNSGVSQILNKPTLATVATSGSYNDLSGKPAIPTKTSDLTNDSNFVTQNDVTTFKAVPNTWVVNSTMASLISSITNDTTAVAGNAYLGTVSLSDLPSGLTQCEMQIYVMAVDAGLGKNILFVITSSNTSPYHWEYTSAWSQTGTWRSFGGGGGTVDWTDVQNKPTFATVATSGSYNDLSNKPSIPVVPTNVSAFNNDAGYSTFSGNYSDLSNKPVIPTKTSDLTNDSDFITSSDIPAQVNSDWNSNSGVSQILNKPTLAAVATSGSYSDLSGKPTIPQDETDLGLTTEVWTFTLQDSTTVTKTVVLK